MRPNLTLTCYGRGSAGVPTTTFASELRARIDSYEHAISATFGYESMRCSFAATLEEALQWLTSGLMLGVTVTGPDADTVWEGLITAVDVQLGQERRSISLDAMANRLKVRYVTVNGVAGVSSTLNDTASQALYGVKETVISIGTATSGEAGNEATVRLAELKNPRMMPASECRTGDLGEIRVSLTCMGWYGTLDWLMTSNSTTSTANSLTQVSSILSTFDATNAFIGNVYATVSGVTATQFIATDTPARAAIENLLKKGDGTNRFAWGVYDSRGFYIDAWAGAAPSTVHYRRRLCDGTLYDAYGLPVQPWNARPNRMYEVPDLLDVTAVSTAQDAAARYCVERVTCRIDSGGMGVTLEPAAFDSVDVRLARIADVWGNLG